jgi:RNA polymerase sigma-70 factor (ECF subfamily)
MLAPASPRFTQSADAGQPIRLEFEDLLRRHQGMVFSIAFHFIQDRSAAEELAQDVFFQLYRHLPSLESDQHVTCWLRRVAAHRCIDYARRRKQPFLRLESVPEPPARDSSSDPLLSRRLRRLIASLSYKARLVMILRYQEDLMPDEIAAAMGMPVATVKSHLQRSLATLREKMARMIGAVRQ